MSKVNNQSSQFYRVSVQCHRQPEVMERVLRVVRHRGFRLETLSVGLSDCGEHFLAHLELFSSRPLGRLTSQLEKLYDVLAVTQSVCSQQRYG